MALTRGRFLGYEFNRMVMLLSMVDGKGRYRAPSRPPPWMIWKV